MGYSLPTTTTTTTTTITEKLRVKSIRFFVQGQNLLTITNYKGLNPEMEAGGVDLNGTPRSQVLSLGLNVNL